MRRGALLRLELRLRCEGASRAALHRRRHVPERKLRSNVRDVPQSVLLAVTTLVGAREGGAVVSESVLVRLVIQAALNAAGLKYEVEIDAA